MALSNRGPPYGDGSHPKGPVGCEHSAVAMAVARRRPDQRREMVNQLLWREGQRRLAIALGLG